MTHSPLSITRRHVLGSLYARCEAITEDVPVFITPPLGQGERSLSGHVNESLGHYADAFTFHLPDDVCKQLSAGYYSYSFDYEHVGPVVKGEARTIRLSSVSLIARQNYTKPAPGGSPAKDLETPSDLTSRT
ncbi:MAG: hypothetical protein JO053_08765 [Acidobacteria bacterium]|nr:hypothetical protein [Acidobacteriota bacterium]